MSRLLHSDLGARNVSLDLLNGGLFPVNVSVSGLRLTDARHRGYWGHFAVTDTGLYLVDSSTRSGIRQWQGPGEAFAYCQLESGAP
jgi:hypothetical protein